MGKQLRANRFAESILSEYGNFRFTVGETKTPYPDTTVKQTAFDWEWNGYSGFGFIKHRNGRVITERGVHNDSYMSVHSNSKKQQPNGRNTCSLYNDSELERLFDIILGNTNF